MAVYNERHEEIPDPTPIEVPLNYRRPEPLAEMIARMIRVESHNAERNGMETFEEADDLEIPDEEGDLALDSKYTVVDMEEEYYDARSRDSKKDEKIASGREPVETEVEGDKSGVSRAQQPVGEAQLNT